MFYDRRSIQGSRLACCHLQHSASEAWLYGVQVEVSCLEDVMRSMQNDTSGEWAQAFFVPAGGMSEK